MTDEPTIADAHAPPAVSEARIRRGLRRMAFITWLLDDCFSLPGRKERFGLDGVLGLIPGAGDVLTGVVQMYLLVEAGSIGVHRQTLWKMLGNVVIDTSVGCIPIVGDVFDFMFKASTYNLELARADLEAHHVLEPGRLDAADRVEIAAEEPEAELASPPPL